MLVSCQRAQTRSIAFCAVGVLAAHIVGWLEHRKIEEFSMFCGNYELLSHNNGGVRMNPTWTDARQPIKLISTLTPEVLPLNEYLPYQKHEGSRPRG